MLDYQSMIKDYEKDAENVQKTIDKLKAKLKKKGVNREELNSLINSYELVHSELIGSINVMREKFKNL